MPFHTRLALTAEALASAAAARPGRPRNVERRREIAGVATRVFAERGYAGATMREVAEACGMGETLLYRYFVRKDVLLDAVVERALERVAVAGGALAAASARGLDARAFLATAARIVLHHIDAERAWYALWLGGLPLSVDQCVAVGAAQERLYATIAAHVPLRRASRDAGALVRVVCGAIESHVLRRSSAHGTADAPEHDVFLEGLLDVVMPPGDARAGFPRARSARR